MGYWFTLKLRLCDTSRWELNEGNKLEHHEPLQTNEGATHRKLNLVNRDARQATVHCAWTTNSSIVTSLNLWTCRSYEYRMAELALRNILSSMHECCAQLIKRQIPVTHSFTGFSFILSHAGSLSKLTCARHRYCMSSTLGHFDSDKTQQGGSR